MHGLLTCFLGLFVAVLPLAARADVDSEVQAAVDAVYPALVRIQVVSEEGGGGRMRKKRSSGSGTIISSEGHILTNHHVAGRATRIRVRLADRQELPATLVGTDPLADLAVLRIEKKDLRDPEMELPVARFGDSSKLEVGEVVLAMGSPGGGVAVGDPGDCFEHRDDFAGRRDAVGWGVCGRAGAVDRA